MGRSSVATTRPTRKQESDRLRSASNRSRKATMVEAVSQARHHINGVRRSVTAITAVIDTEAARKIDEQTTKVWRVAGGAAVIAGDGAVALAEHLVKEVKLDKDPRPLDPFDPDTPLTSVVPFSPEWLLKEWLSLLKAWNDRVNAHMFRWRKEAACGALSELRRLIVAGDLDKAAVLADRILALCCKKKKTDGRMGGEANSDVTEYLGASPSEVQLNATPSDFMSVDDMNESYRQAASSPIAGGDEFGTEHEHDNDRFWGQLAAVGSISPTPTATAGTSAGSVYAELSAHQETPAVDVDDLVFSALTSSSFDSASLYSYFTWMDSVELSGPTDGEENISVW